MVRINVTKLFSYFLSLIIKKKAYLKQFSATLLLFKKPKFIVIKLK